MTPNFPRTNEALYHTLTYFKVGRISAQIKKFSGGINLSYLDSWYEITLRSHEDMENEINQNIIGSVPFIQLSLFEYLRDWLNSWQFKDGFEMEIEYLIDKENEKELLRHKLEIENDEIEYKKTIPPGIPEGGEYEVEFGSYFDIFLRQTRPARKEKRINKFITDKKPDLIDKSYIPEYVLLVKTLTDSFRRHSEKYVTNFFDGKYSVNTNLLAVSTPHKELNAPTIQVDSPKLKVKLSVPQLAYLFKLLYDLDLLDVATKAELKRFILSNISTKGSEDISDKSLENKLSVTEKAEADWWADKLMIMYKAAKKV